MIEHKPLIEYLPPFLAEYREYKRIMDVVWDEISEDEGSILERIDRGLQNTFIEDADLEGIKRWEQMLSIIPDADMTLNDRKEVVRVRMAGRRPFTFRRMEELLEQLTGVDEYSAEMTGTYQLFIRVAITSKYKRGAVTDLLKQILPANIEVTVELMYHQYLELEEYTHGDLTAFTHHDLREEVLDSE